MRGKLVTLGVLATLLGCSDSAGPGMQPQPTGQLHFLRQDAASPALLSSTESFWAKSGTDRSVALYYAGAAPGDTGERFLRFEVPAEALLRRPNGTAFQAGDSVLITVTAVDPSQFIFAFSPAGLQFNSAHPARLKVEYAGADHDFNDDGTIDVKDDSTEAELNLWRREPPDTLWTVIGSVKFEDLDEIDANITSFTEYAVAW